MGSIDLVLIIDLALYIYLSYNFSKGASLIIVNLLSYENEEKKEANQKTIKHSLVSGFGLIPVLMEIWMIIQN